MYWRFLYYRRKLHRLYLKLRFGEINVRNVDVLEGVVCEREYTDCRGRVIGYWGYGSYDPNLPYRGEY